MVGLRKSYILQVFSLFCTEGGVQRLSWRRFFPVVFVTITGNDDAHCRLCKLPWRVMRGLPSSDGGL